MPDSIDQMRNEAIELLMKLDREDVLEELLENIRSFSQNDPQDLSPEANAIHMEALRRSKEDFEAGRFYTHEEVEAWIDQTNAARHMKRR